MSLTKKRKVAESKVDKNKVYSLKEAAALVKEINCKKFDSSQRRFRYHQQSAKSSFRSVGKTENFK